MSLSTEQQVLKLIQQDAVEGAQLESLFNQLKPVELEFMLGEWNGGIFNDGHPSGEVLRQMKWAGKTFHSTEYVEPVLLHGEQPGERVWCKEYGLARIRRIEFRGTVSASMIYDDKPIIDYFRLVDDHTVMGVMDVRAGAVPGDNQPSSMYYFYLTRVHKSESV